MGIYNREKKLEIALKNMEDLEISDNNKQLIKDFLQFLADTNLTMSTNLLHSFIKF
jgi:tRNA A58 N-methylase Trm61